MKIPCDRASFEAQTVGDKNCIVECEGVRYDLVLQEIIDEKGVEFVKDFIGDDTCEDKKECDVISWRDEVDRCEVLILGMEWAYNISRDDDLLEVTINLPFYAKINATFSRTDIKQLNEFCEFLEGKK